MIIRSRLLVPMIGEPIENGAVAINENRIIRVGRFEEVRNDHLDGELLDLGDQILLPGFINAHCHLDYTMLRGRIPRQHTFTDWVRTINELKATLEADDYLAAITAGLRESLEFGTTAMVNLEAFPELLFRLATPSLRVWWCGEMIDVRTQVLPERICADLQRWSQSQINFLGGIGLAPHALYTASSQLLTESSTLGGTHHLLLTTHLAESREEMQMFRSREGPLFEFLRSIGRPMNDCGVETPVSRLIRNQKINDRWIVAHLNEITEDDFTLLETSPRFHVVHCPSSHAFFGHTPFALCRLQRLGFNICLGTDSLASSPSLSVLNEMRKLLDSNPTISPREALKMATVNGARAIGKADSLGQIKEGHSADLIAIPHAQSDADCFETIISFEGKVPWTMINGEVIGSG